MNFFADKSVWQKTIIIVLILMALIVWPLVDHYEHLIETCEDSKLVYLQHPDTIKFEHLVGLNSLPKSKLKKGLAEMKKHKLVIVGITRDNAYDLQVMMKNIEYIGGLFEDYRVILFENDSKDGTKKILHSWWLSNRKIKVISKNYGNDKLPNRQFLSEARNHYLNILESEKYKGFDMVMAVDMDMSYGIDIRGIEDSFSKINKWDAICSNSTYNSAGNMYDVFSFRNEAFPWTPKKWQRICEDKDEKNAKWNEVCKNGVEKSRISKSSTSTFSKKVLTKNQLYWLLIAPQMQEIYPVTSDLVPVTSCFGGIAFYKRAYIENCRYSSVDDDSEHVAFHNCIKDKHDGKMFMNPAQIFRYAHFAD